jgi:hypothetical protein
MQAVKKPSDCGIKNVNIDLCNNQQVLQGNNFRRRLLVSSNFILPQDDL